MKNEKGFTLIELVVSIAVLSIIIVPFFGIFTNAAKMDVKSKTEMTANFLAQEIVANVKNNPNIFEEKPEWTTASAINLGDLFEDENFKDFLAQIEYVPITDLSVTQTITGTSGFDASKPNATIKIGFQAVDDEKTNKVFDYEYYDSDENIVSNNDIVIGENNDTEIEFKVQSDELIIGIKSANATLDINTQIEIPDSKEIFIIKIIWDTSSDDPKNNTSISLINKNNSGTNYNVQFITENFGKNSVGSETYDVDIKTTGDVEPYAPAINNSSFSSEDLWQLSVTVQSYDPFEKNNKVLEHFLTTVRQ